MVPVELPKYDLNCQLDFSDNFQNLIISGLIDSLLHLTVIIIYSKNNGRVNGINSYRIWI